MKGIPVTENEMINTGSYVKKKSIFNYYLHASRKVYLVFSKLRVLFMSSYSGSPQAASVYLTAPLGLIINPSALIISTSIYFSLLPDGGNTARCFTLLPLWLTHQDRLKPQTVSQNKSFLSQDAFVTYVCNNNNHRNWQNQQILPLVLRISWIFYTESRVKVDSFKVGW